MNRRNEPGFRLSTIVLVGLALSIGWGIRGNFGHEYGAMIPGALAAIAVCLMSGREDWRRRVAYFAFFGAIGWGFGGSISYGQVIAYTHSGDTASVAYGFAALFVIGYLWGGMGGAGTAFPAVVDRTRLSNVFPALVWVFAVWGLWSIFGDAYLARFDTGADATWHRQNDPLYWFDTDWWAAFMAVVAACLYGLCAKSVGRLFPPIGAGVLAAFVIIFLQFFLGFHWFWLAPAAVIAAMAFRGVTRRCFDEALVMAGAVGGLAGLGVLIGYETGLAFEHFYAEAGMALALFGCAIWRSRHSVASFVVGAVVALTVTAWMIGRWNIRLDDPFAIGFVVLLAAMFMGLVALPLSRGHGLAAFAIGGAVLGSLAQGLGSRLGLGAALARTGIFPRHLGDLGLFEKAAEEGSEIAITESQRALLDQFGGNIDLFREDLLTNWPHFVSFEGTEFWLGWLLGMLAGAALFFARRVRFDFGSKLVLHMAIGWFAGFLLFPVLLDLHMTPPRSDSWAGTLGLFVGTLVFLFRNGLAPVVYASLVSGMIGGIGFSGAVFLKLMMARVGNPRVVSDASTVANWAHYQSANWHSFLEQSYGFINGVGIAITMALLARYTRPVIEQPVRRRWTGPFAVGFVLFYLVFVNWRKAVGTWIGQGAVPERMRLFWFEWAELSSGAWFAIVFWLAAGAGIVLLIRNTRRPLAMVPATWLGRGQLLFLVFLWVAAIFNFERALTGFSENRMITEAVIIVNAAIASVLLLSFARDRDAKAIAPRRTRRVPYIAALCAGLLVLVFTTIVQTNVLDWAYKNLPEDTSALGGRPQYRMGPDAEWRIRPLLKSEEFR